MSPLIKHTFTDPIALIMFATQLDVVLQEAKKRFPDVYVGLLIADVADLNSMRAMCQRSRLLLNCVGPYRFYGEQVVQVSAFAWFYSYVQFRDIAEFRFLRC